MSHALFCFPKAENKKFKKSQFSQNFVKFFFCFWIKYGQFGLETNKLTWSRLKFEIMFTFGVNYCWNYGPLMLLHHFIEYRLDQLNKKHKKIAVKSTIQFFRSHYQKKCLVKVWRFLAPLQNDCPVKSMRIWTETIF